MNDNLIYIILGGFAFVGFSSLGLGKLLSKLFGNKRKQKNTHSNPRLPKYSNHKKEYEKDEDTIDKTVGNLAIDSLLDVIDASISNGKRKK